MFTLCAMLLSLSFLAFFVLLFLAFIKLLTKRGPALKKLFIIDIVVFIVSTVGACLLDDDSSSSTDSEQTVEIIQTTETVTEITTEVITEVTTQITTQAPTTTTETTVAPTTQVVTEPTTQAPVSETTQAETPLTNITYEITNANNYYYTFDVSFTNNSSKEIKYVRIEVYPLNAVMDPVSDMKTLKITGPISPHKKTTHSSDMLSTNGGQAEDIAITGIEIEYMDGSYDYMGEWY